SYQATDGNLLSNPATVTVNVAAVNDAPIAVADTLTATEDTPVTYTAAQLLVNDTDAEGSLLRIVSVASGTNGTVVLNTDSTVTFTPNANFNGVATFSYQITDGSLISAPATVTVNVASVNDAPVAVANTLAATEDTVIIYTAAQLLGNDTDVDSPVLTIASVTSGSNGTAVLNGDGTVTFTPNANFNGVVNFTYQATDGVLLSNPATVTVNVAPVNDAPVAVADTLAATEDTVIIYTAAQLLGNDTDVDSPVLTIASVTSGSNGTAVLNGNGTVTFTPNANFNGAANFTYQATDGLLLSSPATVTVNVAPVNDAPVANPDSLVAPEDIAITYLASDLLGNDTDVEGSPLTITSVTSGNNGTAVLNANGSVTFTSALNFNGVANFTYKASDGLLNSNSATVTVNVVGTNDAPVLTTPATVTYIDTPFVDTFTTATGFLVGTDVDTGTTLTYGITGGTDNGDGTVSMSSTYGVLTVTKATGEYKFVPNGVAIEPLGQNVSSTFSVVVSDGALSASKSFTVAITQNGSTETNGSDILINGVGVNHWAGLQGDDTYYVDVAGDIITENVGEGTDIVYSSAASYTLADNVESLVIWLSGVNGTGNGLNNYIIGSDGSNIIDGGAGADIMYGGLGSDTYYVDNIGDVVTEVGTDWDVVYSTAASYTLGANIEALFLVDDGVNRNGNGNDQVNYLIGNTGNNILDGKGGADVMAGHAGDDTYYVDNAGDSVIENASEGFDTVYSSIDYTLTANVEALVLTGAAITGIGNNLNNTLTGNSANNALGGGAGVDTLIGGAGDDTYYVDDALDSIIENVGEGADIVYSTAASYTLGTNVESLVIWGAGINGTGNTQDNFIIGSAGNNIIDGAAGNDTMYGGEGADTYIGGLGADILTLTETTPTTDIVRIAAGDSLATVGGYDTVTGFKLGTGVFNTLGVDQLDLDNTAIAINAASVDGNDVGNIRSHSLSNGIISFDDINSYTAPLAITTADLSNVFGYLQGEITGGLTVAFISEGNTYVFQDGGAVDTVVELVGVTASSINTVGQGVNALWLV
ncbi:MAG: tandem-95 repeat protein, partial [Methylococcales bacterium]|nr:tandem-95 repeat protein [Methylococcales bacterium]